MYPVNPFHLAFPVDDLQVARVFYTNVLGCSQGRSSDTWIDFNLYGHQIVAHFAPGTGLPNKHFNEVDQHQVPVPHFGVILEWDAWEELAARLKNAKVDFVIEPYVRFVGQSGEQATLFFLDPAGNALEFKAFKDPEQIFTT